MNFFSRLIHGVTAGVAMIKGSSAVSSASQLAKQARFPSETLAVSERFAQSLPLYQRGVDKIIALADRLGDTDGAAHLRQSAPLAIGGIRILTAYFAHVSQQEPLGDFIIEQSLDLERRWSSLRSTILAERPVGQTRISEMSRDFASLALATSIVGFRALAAREKLQGQLSADRAQDLASRCRSLHQDATRLSRIMLGPKIQRLESASDAKSQEQARHLRLTLSSQVQGPMEEAQILFMGGLRDQALHVLSSALERSAEPERNAALDALRDELALPARGNNPEFCHWALLSVPAIQQARSLSARSL